MSRYCGTGGVVVVGGGGRGGGGARSFYTNYFLATKLTGGFRPILNLSGLNMFLCVSKFYTETSISQALHKRWWIVS